MLLGVPRESRGTRMPLQSLSRTAGLAALSWSSGAFEFFKKFEKEILQS